MNETEWKSHREAIRKIGVFRYLDDAQYAELAALAEIVTFAEGQRVVSEGEVDSSLYAVLSGSVNVFVGSRPESQKQVFICALGEGDVFGEAGIFLQTPRTAGVVAGPDAVLLRVGRDSLFSFIHRHPAAGIKILYVLIYGLLRKLRESNQELAFERKTTMAQEDVDSIVEAAMKGI